MRARFVLWLSLLATLGSSASLAQELPRTSILEPIASDGVSPGLAGGIVRVIRARLDELGTVSLADTPPLSLADLQLAVGCVGETSDCLQALAAQLEVQALILTSVDEAAGDLVLSITFFDARDPSGRRQVVRQASGEDAGQRLLAETEGAVRELFGLPAPPPPADPELPVDEPGVSRSRALPWSLIAASGVMLVSGVALGFSSKANEDEFAAARPETRGEVDAALEAFDRGTRQATAANVLYAIGGAAAIAGVLLFFLPRRAEPAERDAAVLVQPVAGSHELGVSLGGRF